MVGEAGVEIYLYDDPAGHFGKANVGLIFRGSTPTFYYAAPIEAIESSTRNTKNTKRSEFQCNWCK